MGNGFLGFPASTVMLDFVVCALVAVVPLILFSLYLVKVRRNFVAHRNLQIALAVVLLVTVAAFEIDMRLHGGWKAIVDRPAGRLTAEQFSRVEFALYVHLVFAISTPVLWLVTIVLALKTFSKPPQPGTHSPLHKLLGWLSTIDITLTSVTGLVFYYLAFVSK